ncbi:sigma-70 family RNA polymerase sigma factor [Sphingomonas sp. HITSZ_GF]|uniref:RNA polymerase sigma factor n=1 Tax=Sphingomonas sp. HITSZ_GF TaxID=3037247 RepID=UPI00240D8D39|nr:sigma-70 family RNA polymerase sigma factor [Sphingomonas sp. HITSZ_GF]MDG2535180.1 sigma-70 family RNA polymerase sigma factor [Sphingomonas sp. HITSZ_GF]
MKPAPEPARSDVAAIADSYRSALYAFFLRRLRNPADAEDAIQELFAALSRRGTPQGIENVERYVFQAAANQLRDRARRVRARPPIDLHGGADPHEQLVDEISPERELLGREAYAGFIAALQELPQRARDVFVLNRFEEMTGREIAYRLGISQRQVEKDISRALSHLRERLS